MRSVRNFVEEMLNKKRNKKQILQIAMSTRWADKIDELKNVLDEITSSKKTKKS